MKYFVIFIFAFLLVSVLPFLWNQFSFVEAGFPFTYLKKTNYEDAMGSSFMVSFVSSYLVYDLVIVGIFVWLLTYIRTYIKGNT
jgi:hypothetical protein